MKHDAVDDEVDRLINEKKKREKGFAEAAMKRKLERKILF